MAAGKAAGRSTGKAGKKAASPADGPVARKPPRNAGRPATAQAAVDKPSAAPTSAAQPRAGKKTVASKAARSKAARTAQADTDAKGQPAAGSPQAISTAASTRPDVPTADGTAATGKKAGDKKAAGKPAAGKKAVGNKAAASTSAARRAAPAANADTTAETNTTSAGARKNASRGDGKPAAHRAGKAATQAAAAVSAPEPSLEPLPEPLAEPVPDQVPDQVPAPMPPVAPAAGAQADAATARPAADFPTQAPTPAAAPGPHRSGPAHSRLLLQGDDQRQIAWLPGADCPPALAQAMARRLDPQGRLPAGDDAALPLLLRLAAEAQHRVDVAPELWLYLAAQRDSRTRCALLAQAYPDGPASPALQRLLAVPLPLFQAEGALWAVVAGRALLADAPGLGKGVQAIAAAQLWRQHFGLRRVAVLCSADQVAAWQRAWQLLAGISAQPMSGGLHQRQALWSAGAEVRILSPEALASDAAHLQHWAPELVLVDEPQRLIDAALPAGSAPPWAAVAAPQALVLCGGPLDTQPDLLDGLINWLDPQRMGPLAALRRVRAARDAQQPLADDALEDVAAQLSRVLLQREHGEVAAQLPPVITSARLLPLAPAQQAAHANALREARTLVQAWQRSGFVSDADQWRLSALLRQLQQAAHRADPGAADSPLAEAVLQAAASQLADWAEAEPLPTVLLCDSLADQAQWAQRLGAQPGLHLVAPGEPLPCTPARVLQVGVPWRTRRQPLTARDAAEPAEPGQHWVLLAAQGSIDIGLLDTLAGRHELPHGPAEPAGRGFLQGVKLGQWLRAVAAALAATPADAAASGLGA